MKKEVEMKISVVVPVYNTKGYLRQCVESLLKWNNETNTEGKGFPGEILLVDNGSTDGSFELAEDLAKLYPKVEIRVLKCETKGAAAARNYGLREAKGEWVWFVDSDDFVVPAAIAKLFGRISQEPDAEVVTIAMQRVSESGFEKKDVLPAVRAGLDDRSMKLMDWAPTFVRYGLGPVQVPAKREFLLKDKLFYDEGMIHEDMAIISAYILYTEKIASLKEPIYMYRQRKGSVLHSSKWNEHELDIFKALELLSGRFEKAGRYEEFKAELEYFYIWNLLDDAARQFAKFKEGRRNFAQIRHALQSRFPKWRKNKYFLECGWKVQLRCRLAYHGIVK